MIVYAAETPLYMFTLTGSRTLLWISDFHQSRVLTMAGYGIQIHGWISSDGHLNFWQHGVAKGEGYCAQRVESSEDLSRGASL